MTDHQQPNEQYSLSMMYGTYADILFVLFPFLVITCSGYGTATWRRF